MPPKPKIYTQEQVNVLRDCYANKKMSTNDISHESSNLFGLFVSNGTIYKELIRHKIPIRNKSESISRATSSLNIDESYLDEKTIEWIDGFLLGDGSIGYNKITFKSSRFGFGSAEEQWTNYAMSGLKKYDPTEASSKGWKFRIEKPSRPTFTSVSKMHPDIIKQAKRWYPEGKKKVPVDVRITPTSMLLWYLGDGSIGKGITFTAVQLATCSFLPQDNINILMHKLEQIGLHCRYSRGKNDIIICGESMGLFFDYIGHKSPISCYDYKFNIPEWKYLTNLKCIIPDKKERWRALYYIKSGQIPCSKSPGGHYFLFNREQEKFLVDKLQYKKKYDGSFRETNANISLRKKEWDTNIPIDFQKTNNISTPINSPINELIIWKNNLLTYQYLKSINEDKRDEVAKDLLNFFLKYDFVKTEYSTEEINDDWKKLKLFKTETLLQDNIKYINNSNLIGTKIYKHFFPDYIKVKQRDRLSIYEALTNKEILFKIIRDCVGNTLLYKSRQWMSNISPKTIIDMVKRSRYATIENIFNPMVAKSIYNKYTKSKYNVLDYSCGFGSRLLGLMALENNCKYFGIEPNLEICNVLIKMSQYFNFNANIKNVCSEDFIFEEKMDFIFSSPPFFNIEIYCQDKNQCYNKHPKYTEWLEKYFRKTIKNCKIMMKPESKFAVNVGNSANVFMKQISEDFKRILAEEKFVLFDSYYLKPFHNYLGGKKKIGVRKNFEEICFYHL